MRWMLLIPFAIWGISIGCGGGDRGAQADRGNERPRSTRTPGDADVRFKSVFWASVTDDGEPRVEPIRDRVSLAGGTELGWIVESPPGLHLYVFHRTDDGDFQALQPAGTGALRALLPRGTRLDDNPGLERFYMIAARQPIARLDALAADLDDPGRRGAASRSLDDEIGGLRRRYEKRERVAARPTRIGGSVRGSDPVDHAIWYEAEEIGVWTFTVEHR